MPYPAAYPIWFRVLIATAVIAGVGVCLAIGAWAWWKIFTSAGIL